MLAHLDAPIAAIATAPGRGAVGIVRVSGAAVEAVAAAVCGRTLKPREATYLPFRAADGSTIDQGLAIRFPAPHSYTGEDVLELQAHGGPIVLQLLLARCLEAGAARGLRVAEPGEFTRRAFLNGKLDLAQAEAVADLIDASTEAAARSAGRALAGAFSREVHALRDALVELRTLVEATLDFPEEEIDFLQQSDAAGRLDRLQAGLAAVLDRARQGALLREGIQVVIAGQPNAGKSSLLNALAGAELAIVTPIPGTTRDVVREQIQIEGVPVHVIDTAGLRESSDAVERIGIERAWAQIAQADAVLFVRDLTRAEDPAYLEGDAAVAASLRAKLPEHTPVVEVWNKSDAAIPAQAERDAVIPAHRERAVIPAQAGIQEVPRTTVSSADTSCIPAFAGMTDAALVISALSGEGLDALRARLLQLAGWHAAPEGLYIARERHLQALRAVDAHLMEAAAQLQSPQPALELLAEELRLAQNALNTITGEFGVEDLLGEIFGRFCIGK